MSVFYITLPECLIRFDLVGRDTLLYFDATADVTPAHIPFINNSGEESYDTIIGGIMYRQKPIYCKIP